MNQQNISNSEYSYSDDKTEELSTFEAKDFTNQEDFIEEENEGLYVIKHKSINLLSKVSKIIFILFPIIILLNILVFNSNFSANELTFYSVKADERDLFKEQKINYNADLNKPFDISIKELSIFMKKNLESFYDENIVIYEKTEYFETLLRFNDDLSIIIENFGDSMDVKKITLFIKVAFSNNYTRVSKSTELIYKEKIDTIVKSMISIVTSTSFYSTKFSYENLENGSLKYTSGEYEFYFYNLPNSNLLVVDVLRKQ